MQNLTKHLIEKFDNCCSWEDRYRILIEYSKQIPPYSEVQLNAMHEILGCENKIWIQGKLVNNNWQFSAYSEARIMRGILAIIVSIINNKTSLELKNINLMTIFTNLKIAQNLTQTRLKSIENLNSYIKNLV